MRRVISPPAFGVFTDAGDSSGTEPIDSLQAKLGRRIDSGFFFKAIASPWGPQINTSFLAQMKASGRTVMVTIEPWDVGNGSATQPAYTDRQIASGRYDAQFRAWADQIKTIYPTPVYVRYGHEMNGNWYPWAGGANGNAPAGYVAAWRHVWSVMRSRGATNIRWVWAPNTMWAGAPAWNAVEQYWPGATYVDVIGIDSYNFGQCIPANGGWIKFAQLLNQGGTYARVAALSASKPIWWAEGASTSVGGDKPAWIRDVFANGRMYYPRLAQVNWFSTNKECDWRADENAQTAAAFVVA